MPYQRSTISKGAIDASQLTRQREARVRFADIRVQKERFEAGCASRINTESTGQQDYVSQLLIREGAVFTTPAELATILEAGACSGTTPAPPPPPPPYTGPGSMYFDGSANTHLLIDISGDSDFEFGTGDFTIEWFQKQIPTGQVSRVFSVGSWPTAVIGVSIESSGRLFFWANYIAISQDIDVSAYMNGWAHFACVRSSGLLTIYANGSVIDGPIDISTKDFSNFMKPLIIGNETSDGSTPTSAFNGSIASFSWTKGYAAYTAPFTPPFWPLGPYSTTAALLGIFNFPIQDEGVKGKTISNTGVTDAQDLPFPPPYTGAGSMDFHGIFADLSGSGRMALTIPNNPSIRMGTGDFTIEWYQKMVELSKQPSDYPRIFSMGAFPYATMAVSIENGNIRFWFMSNGNRVDIFSGYDATSDISGVWAHIAICRYGSNMDLWINGSRKDTSSALSGIDFNDSINNLAIGNESPGIGGDPVPYKGLLAGFRITKYKLYGPGAFTPPSYPLTALADTTLLINQTILPLFTDESSSSNTIENSLVWSSIEYP